MDGGGVAIEDTAPGGTWAFPTSIYPLGASKSLLVLRAKMAPRRLALRTFLFR
jgi:hypothetical protein